MKKNKTGRTLFDGEVIEENSTYAVFETDKAFDGAAIHCKKCGKTSYNHNDVKYRFCGACELFHNPEGARRPRHKKKNDA